MRALPSVRSALALACVIVLEAAGAAAQEKPRYGGVLTWFDYGDPGRLDVHAESPLVVGLQAGAHDLRQQHLHEGLASGVIRISTDSLRASRFRIQRPMKSGTMTGYFRRYAPKTASSRSGRSSTHSARPSNDGPSGVPSATRTRPVALIRRALRLVRSGVK